MMSYRFMDEVSQAQRDFVLKSTQLVSSGIRIGPSCDSSVPTPAMRALPLIAAIAVVHLIYPTRDEHLHLCFRSQRQYLPGIYHPKTNY